MYVAAAYNITAAIQVAENLRVKIAGISVPSDGGDISLTVSIGIAESKKSDLSCSDILKRADKSLYSAKNAGRNRVGVELT